MSETLVATSKVPLLSHERFVESNPEITQGIVLLTAGLEDLKAINTDIIGASLFGSVLKGTAHEKSDYDTNIFIDANKLTGMGAEVGIDNNGTSQISDPALKAEYSSYISSYLAKKMNKPQPQIEQGIFIVPISNEIIDSELDNYVSKCEPYQRYQDALDSWLNNDMEGDRPQEAEVPLISRSVGALFSAELTAGLESYRQHTIDKLDRMGKFGEDGWKDIVLLVKFGEGHLNDSVYPKDLEEANATYGAHRAAQ